MYIYIYIYIYIHTHTHIYIYVTYPYIRLCGIDIGNLKTQNFTKLVQV